MTPEQLKQLKSQMLRNGSEAHLQCAIELMLASHDTYEVIQHLDAWADYLRKRT